MKSEKKAINIKAIFIGLIATFITYLLLHLIYYFLTSLYIDWFVDLRSIGGFGVSFWPYSWIFSIFIIFTTNLTGGYTTAFLAGRQELQHGIVLAILLILLAIILFFLYEVIVLNLIIGIVCFSTGPITGAFIRLNQKRQVKD